MPLSAVCPGKLSWDLGLKSHPKAKRSPRSNTRHLVYHASSFTITPSWLISYLSHNQNDRKSDANVIAFNHVKATISKKISGFEHKATIKDDKDNIKATVF